MPGMMGGMPGMMGGMPQMGMMGGVIMPPPHRHQQQQQQEDPGDITDDERPVASNASVPAAESGVASTTTVPGESGQQFGGCRTDMPVNCAPEDCRQRMSGDCVICRLVMYLRQMPRNRLGEWLESLSPGVLDATLTAELSCAGVLYLLWLFTRMRPSVRVSDLRDLK